MTLFPQELARGLAVPDDLRTVEIDGTRLAYRERGSGAPVVLVHGSISDLTAWEPQLDALAQRYRIIAYSRRYAWPNVDLPAGKPDPMDRHVDDLLTLLEVLGARPAHLVGNSWGAFVCLVAAMRQPTAVRSLVLEEPPLVPLIAGSPPSPPVLLRSLLRRPRTTLAGLRFVTTTLKPMGKLIEAGQVDESIDVFARGVLGDRGLGRLPDEFRQHMRANAATHVGQALADGGFPSVTEDDIRSVTAPTLVVSGADSPPFFRRLAGLLASLLPASEVLLVPAASHAMHLENPAVVNAGVLRFLDRHSDR